MREDFDLTNFTKGELSPRMKSRIDVAGYYNGADTLRNVVVLPQGGATKRPGTLFVGAAKDQSATLNRCRAVPFIFSTVQAYLLEFTTGNVRVYMNDAVVLTGGAVPVDIVVPYQAADLAALQWTQSADTLYLFHPLYPTASLTRTSHTSWTYGAIAFRDGPYLPINSTATTLTPSATSGNITVTASSITGINPTTPNNPATGQGFLASDIGRLIRINVGGVWGWVLITAVTSTTVISATVQAAVTGIVSGAAGALGGTTATVNWSLGKWSGTTGYPYLGGFFQQRLFFLGTNNQPNAIEGSVSSDFTNMASTDSAGTVVASHALSWLISDDQVNAIRWMSAAGSAQAANLGIGTSGGENILQPATNTAALSSTNVQVYRETQYGAATNLRPLRIGKAVVFVDRTGRKIREWVWQWVVNGYLGPDVSQFSEHITRNGLKQFVYQQTPNQVIWGCRGDGGLIAITYDHDQQIFAPVRHQLGGQYYGGAPYIEDLAVIPSTDGTYDELWLAVVRTINGTPTRTIEVMTKYFDAALTDDAVFVDCALQSVRTLPAATVTPTGFTPSWVPGSTPETTDPSFTGTGVLAASAGVFAAGDVNKIVRLNGGKLQITGFTDSQHVAAQVLLPMTILAPAASGAWSSTALSTSFSGLSYLNGETVAILGDGAVYPSQAVAGGAVSIAGNGPGASFATVGLPYTPVIVTMPFEPQRAAQIASQGKAKRIDALYLRLHETVGCDFGRRITDEFTKAVIDILEPLESRSASDPMGQSPALFSGAKRLAPQGGYDLEGQIIITQEDPLPLTVLSIFARAEVGELVGPPA